MRATAYVFLGRSFNSAISLVFSLIAGRLLSVEEHGLYGRTLATIVIIQAVAEFGLQLSLVRYLSAELRGDRRNVGALLRASIILKLSGLALPFVLILVYQGVLHIQGLPWQTLLWLALLGGTGLSLLSYLDSLLVSYEAYGRLALWLPSTGFFRLGLLTFFYFQQKIDAAHVLFAFSLAPYLAGLFFFAFFRPGDFLKAAPRGSVKDWTIRLVTYNAWILAASIVSIVSDWLEVLLLTRAADAGLYNAARLPMQGFLILLATMQSIILPQLARLRERSELAAYFRKLYFWLIPGVLLLLPGVFIFAFLLPLWYGPEYQASLAVLYILYPSFALRLVFAPLGTALYSLDRPHLIAAETFLKLVSGFLLNLWLIPQYGITGAAIAGASAQVTGWVFLLIFYYRYFHEKK